MAEIQDVTNQLLENVEKVIVGKTDAIRLTITGLLCQGHILIEDVPGTGTTTVCKFLSEAIDLEHVYAGDLFRKMAEAKGMDLVAFNIYSAFLA